MKIKKQIIKILIITSIFFNLITYTYPIESTSNININNTNISTNSKYLKISNTNLPQPDFTLASEGAVLMDSSTGAILYGKNENEKLYPASTTKVLTAIIAIENCNITEEITASYDAVMSLPAGYSNAAIQPGETLKFQDLLDMFLIHSANEIGNIFAEHISGNIKDFATLMNKKAAEIGCKNTHFTNPSGIHDVDHYSTAYDMALITRYCMKNETFRKTVAKTSCTVDATDKYEKRYFKNTNDLLHTSSKYYYEYAIGVKTGYTSQAKRCLLATSQKDNLELIAVVLGAQSTTPDTRYLDTINLFNYGYTNFKIKQIATKNSLAKEITIENATKDTKNLSLLLNNDITALMPTNLKLTNLDSSIKLNETITAPISEGDILGKITYTVEGIEYSSDLIASHNVEKFDLIKILKQVGFAILILFILIKIFLPNKKNKSKKGYYKNKKSNTKKRSDYKKSNDSIYKF